MCKPASRPAWTIWPALWSPPASSPLDRRNAPPRPNKGFDVLIDAFACAHGRLAGRQPIIIGGWSARGELDARVARSGPVGRVVLTGHLGSAHPPLWGAALVVLPSRSEGMGGIVLPGAVAHGPPFTATDRGSGSRHLLEDGRCGPLVPGADAGAPAEATAARVADPCARARRGPGGARGFGAERRTDALRTATTTPVGARR